MALSLQRVAEDPRQVVTRRDLGDPVKGDNLDSNIAIVEKLDELASEKGATAAQLALGWVHSRGEDVFPIPGTKRRTYLEENVAAFDIELSDDELSSLEGAVDDVAGDRYDESGMASVNR